MEQSFEQLKMFLNSRDVTLVAVTKTRIPQEVLKIYEQGHRVFGENKAQELAEKFEALPKDIEWHLIGHLQTNKVKIVIPLVTLIHSVDSWRLLDEIEKQSAQLNRITEILIQVHIAAEETKYGLSIEDARKMLADDHLEVYRNVRIRGLMGIASLTDNQDQVRQEFKRLKVFYDEVRLKLMNVSSMSDIATSWILALDTFNILSMGMSDDYQMAIEEGSTLVRIGRAIFGERNYPISSMEHHDG